MRYPFALAILIAGSMPAAMAADATPFTWTKDKFDLVEAADADSGQALAKKFRCKKCHNKDGISDDPEIPSIAGQRATYMLKQLSDYKNKIRENKDMYKVARKLSEPQMADLSAWYMSLERPQKVGGDVPLVVEVCDSCHEKEIVEEDGQVEVAPILEGQMRQYLEDTMVAFRAVDGEGRSNDLFQRMQSVSHKLTEDEISRLARYYGAKDLEE